MKQAVLRNKFLASNKTDKKGKKKKKKKKPNTYCIRQITGGIYSGVFLSNFCRNGIFNQ